MKASPLSAGRSGNGSVCRSVARSEIRISGPNSAQTTEFVSDDQIRFETPNSSQAIEFRTASRSSVHTKKKNRIKRSSYRFGGGRSVVRALAPPPRNSPCDGLQVDRFAHSRHVVRHAQLLIKNGRNQGEASQLQNLHNTCRRLL